MLSQVQDGTKMESHMFGNDRTAQVLQLCKRFWDGNSAYQRVAMLEQCADDDDDGRCTK